MGRFKSCKQESCILLILLSWLTSLIVLLPINCRPAKSTLFTRQQPLWLLWQSSAPAKANAALRPRRYFMASLSVNFHHLRKSLGTHLGKIKTQSAELQMQPWKPEWTC
jgi:hypothetical protein